MTRRSVRDCSLSVIDVTVGGGIKGPKTTQSGSGVESETLFLLFQTLPTNC